MLTTGILNKAIQMAKKSKMFPFKVGAVIFKGNRIISYGNNYRGQCTRIHPKYRNEFGSTHAEISCITKINDWNKLKNSSILVIRVRRSGILSMAFPCANCMETIKYVGIKEVYYSNRNGEIIREKI